MITVTLRNDELMSPFYSIPSAFPSGPEGGIQVKVISGKSHGVESPVRPLGGCWYFHAIFKQKGTFFQEIRAYSLSSLYRGYSKIMRNTAANWTTFFYSKLFCFFPRVGLYSQSFSLERWCASGLGRNCDQRIPHCSSLCRQG